jgi:hypothetical protein
MGPAANPNELFRGCPVETAGLRGPVGTPGEGLAIPCPAGVESFRPALNQPERQPRLAGVLVRFSHTHLGDSPADPRHQPVNSQYFITANRKTQQGYTLDINKSLREDSGKAIGYP